MRQFHHCSGSDNAVDADEMASARRVTSLPSAQRRFIRTSLTYSADRWSCCQLPNKSSLFDHGGSARGRDRRQCLLQHNWFANELRSAERGGNEFAVDRVFLPAYNDFDELFFAGFRLLTTNYWLTSVGTGVIE